MFDAHVQFHWPFQAVHGFLSVFRMHISIDLVYSLHNSFLSWSDTWSAHFFRIQKLHIHTHTFCLNSLIEKQDDHTEKQVVVIYIYICEQRQQRQKQRKKKTIYNNTKTRTSIITDREEENRHVHTLWWLKRNAFYCALLPKNNHYYYCVYNIHTTLH